MLPLCSLRAELLKVMCLKPVLHSSEKPVHCNQSLAPCSLQLEKACMKQRRPLKKKRTESTTPGQQYKMLDGSGVLSGLVLAVILPVFLDQFLILALKPVL